MDARAVERADRALADLDRQAREAAVLAALVLALAIGATHVFPAFALPLLAGGVWVAGLAVRAFRRHWELLDRLLLDRDAYVISEVRASAARLATMERRHVLAVSIRGGLGEPQLTGVVRTAALAEELNALADELDDDRLALDLASAVARDRLVSGAAESALAPALPRDALCWHIRQIRSGFERRTRAEPGDPERARPSGIRRSPSRPCRRGHRRATIALTKALPGEEA